MKKYLIYVLLLILTVYALYKYNQHEENAIIQKAYTKLITLLEQGSRAGISPKLMQNIISVYDDELLSDRGPNDCTLFRECLKIHQDVLKIMKKAPGLMPKWVQDDFCRELHMLKTCTIIGKSPSWDRVTATQLIEALYLKLLLFQFVQNKDFYDKYLAEAIATDFFTPAAAVTLYMKVFGISPQRLIEAPQVYVVRSQNIPGKILLVAPTSDKISLKTCYVDPASGQISKIPFPKDCKRKFVEVLNSGEVAFFLTQDEFYSWDADNCILSLRGENGWLRTKERIAGVASFQFDRKNMRWVSVESKAEPQ
jgi:hypothetical protein